MPVQSHAPGIPPESATPARWTGLRRHSIPPPAKGTLSGRSLYSRMPERCAITFVAVIQYGLVPDSDGSPLTAIDGRQPSELTTAEQYACGLGACRITVTFWPSEASRNTT